MEQGAGAGSLGSRGRARLRWEIGIVLALSFGASGVYAIVDIVERLSRDTALSSQSVTINRPLAERPAFDLVYQLLGFAFGLAPVALVAFLLWQAGKPHLGRLGLGAPAGGTWRWLRETGGGFALAAAVGIPGIGFYLFAKGIGINLTVVPTALDEHWWTVPMLVLLALRAALGEELIVVAYLFDRLRRLGVGPLATILSSALLRGSYHLYQGFGGFIGNVAMGLLFGWAYHRWGRSLPLIVAHWILDIVSFAGFPLALALWPGLFGTA
ncbi:CPBP family intramembrane glutamic endopeptidase [Leucobacter massiliensis]|uniref:CPBP family intramembrane metalloprotease domain-containing protein n=1 Tax=Leucobacter massiliensis TaxID=1686285 RepID=A0A2S9QPR5_9MICO|nr:CPBP family intramembrane glutamic endopeptidase [Leucobacter massiliensis]PRI11576.1 CPBP family intramembrane metalloprotease domain-containing protein [Leucobacter massiliensis]